MTKEDKRLLVRQAAKLMTFGLTVERERSRLKNLVERDIPYDAPEMLAAWQRFEKADAEWRRLEAEHLELRKKFGM